jgi:hypothetical protein
MKKSLFIRFANEGSYYKHVNIDLTKIKDPMEFPREVFFTIDNLRVAIKREDWDELKENLNKNKYE